MIATHINNNRDKVSWFLDEQLSWWPRSRLSQRIIVPWRRPCLPRMTTAGQRSWQVKGQLLSAHVDHHSNYSWPTEQRVDSLRPCVCTCAAMLSLRGCVIWAGPRNRDDPFKAAAIKPPRWSWVSVSRRAEWSGNCWKMKLNYHEPVGVFPWQRHIQEQSDKSSRKIR